MTRPRGSRNAGFEARRAELLGRLHARLGDRGGGPASLRDLAAAAGVTIPTLRHYFGRRDDVVAAVLAASAEEGRPYVEAASRPSGPFARSIRDLLAFAAEGHRAGTGVLHAIGLAEGLKHERLGPRYVTAILEPSLQAVEARLRAHMEAGEMREADPRHAAIALLAPAILAQLHQDELGGAACRPLDLDAFLDDHAAAFVRAHAAAPDDAAASRGSGTS